MTVVPLTQTDLSVRTTADVDQEFVRYSDSEQLTPLDISAYTFVFKVRPNAVSATETLVGTTANGKCVIISGPSGRMAVRFDKAELAAIVPAGADRFEGVWELAAAGPGGVDESWAAGNFLCMLGPAR